MSSRSVAFRYTSACGSYVSDVLELHTLQMSDISGEHSDGGIVFSDVCVIVNRFIQFLWEQDMVKSRDDLENGCIPSFRRAAAHRRCL